MHFIWSSIFGLSLLFGTGATCKPNVSGVQESELRASSGQLQTKGARVDWNGSDFPVRVYTEPGSYNKAFWEFPNGLDWSDYRSLVIGLKNPTNELVKIGIRLDDDLKATGTSHNRTATIDLEPGQQVSVSFSLAEDIGVMQQAIGTKYRSVAPKTFAPFDSNHIFRIQVMVSQSDTPTQFIVQGMRLVRGKKSLTGLVDKFGQNSTVDFAGKIRSESDLASSDNLEDLKGPALDRNKWGGYTGAAQQRGTGRFRTGNSGGRTCLIDPDGYPFFLMGVDGVRAKVETVVDNRQHVFQVLPSATVDSKNRRVVDFYRSNLAIKYGSNFEPAWRAKAVQRLQSWGFNTIGEYFDLNLRSAQVPFVLDQIISGVPTSLSSERNYTPVPDPFDPNFASAVQTRIGNSVALMKGNPYCIGLSVDNEMAWGGSKASERARYGLAYRTLKKDASKSPGKTFWVDHLEDKYGNIENLNGAWRSNFSDWAQVRGPIKVEGNEDIDMGGDFSWFVTAVAEKYFSTIASTLHRLDPGRLYFGCRFATYTPEVGAAAAKYCDVLTFNIYTRRLDTEKYSFLNDLSKPVVISEFHFGAADRGGLGYGLVDAGTQQGRAEAYKTFVESCANMPNIVGFQYYKYNDDALTGRTMDGENFAIGLVTITDTPYPEITTAASEVNRRLYKLIFG